MKSFLNIKFLSLIGFLGLVFIGSQALIYYSYHSDTKLAEAVEEGRYLFDSLDGEIENPNNPEITAEVLPTTSAETPSPNAPSVVEQKRDGPDRLIIPKLGVDAYIQYVGISRTGNMAIPTNFKDVGWYKLGPKPGEKGNAVIAGHVDNALGMAGVFKNLYKLEAGDIFKVKNSDGKIIEFKVSATKTYAHDQDDTSEVFVGDSRSRLVLITCGGTWLQSQRSYDTRIVVFADLI